MSGASGENEVREGDIVRLKSGGPAMTVRGKAMSQLPTDQPACLSKTALWICEWFENRGLASCRSFYGHQLESYVKKDE
jgi:uncharacterized protein YodC (DUF2158 family)